LQVSPHSSHQACSLTSPPGLCWGTSSSRKLLEFSECLFLPIFPYSESYSHRYSLAIHGMINRGFAMPIITDASMHAYLYTYIHMCT
jgi:hypothetical protein